MYLTCFTWHKSRANFLPTIPTFKGLSKNKVAKFGYNSKRKGKEFLNPTIFFMNYFNISSTHGNFRLIFLKIMMTFAHVFPKKNPLHELQLILFFTKWQKFVQIKNSLHNICLSLKEQ
jgi:hypothetical protein